MPLEINKQSVEPPIRKSSNLELWRGGTLELWNCIEMRTDNLQPQSCD